MTRWNVTFLDERARPMSHGQVEADDSQRAKGVVESELRSQWEEAESYILQEDGIDMSPEESLAVLGQIWDLFRSLQRRREDTTEWRMLTHEGRMMWSYLMYEVMGEGPLESMVAQVMMTDKEYKGRRN